MMKRFVIYLILLTLACNKDDISGNAERANATVFNAGVDTPDGCGWQIRLEKNSQYYHPENLPDNFKKNNLDVIIDYVETTDSFHCGFASAAFPTMHIISITPR